MKQGRIIDRYGTSSGSYAAPNGTPYSMRSLPPGSSLKEYHQYEVLKDIQVEAGFTAPYFNQTGGGIQYKFSNSLDYYINNGYLKQIS